MATIKAKNSNPIKNDGGVVYSEGNLSSLSSISRATLTTDNTKVGTYGGALTFEGSELFKLVKIGNSDNTHYNSLAEYYTSASSGVSYVTGKPTGTSLRKSTFWLNEKKRYNNLSGFIFRVAQDITFRDDSTFPPLVYNMLTSSVSGGKQILTFSLLRDKANFKRPGFALFTGKLNETETSMDKIFTVEFYKNGVVTTTGKYKVDMLSKINISALDVDSVKVTQEGQNYSPFSVGFRNLLEASNVVRTLTVPTSMSNPETLSGGPNISLNTDESAIRLSTTGVGQITIREIDSNGVLSPPVYNVVGPGLKLTYYPSYKDILVSDTQGKTITVEVMK